MFTYFLIFDYFAPIDRLFLLYINSNSLKIEQEKEKVYCFINYLSNGERSEYMIRLGGPKWFLYHHSQPLKTIVRPGIPRGGGD